MNPVPDTCPVNVAVAASISVEEIPVENEPVAPSIFPVTSPVTAPVKAPSNVLAETVPENTADVPDTAPLNVPPPALT